MITAKVISPFISNGSTIKAGTIIRIDEESLPSLAGLVEVITPADLKAQRASSDWRWFCDSHERTLPDGRCEVKHDRLDPMTDCVGWQLKTGRSLH
jgi:hypothetical protein